MYSRKIIKILPADKFNSQGLASKLSPPLTYLPSPKGSREGSIPFEAEGNDLVPRSMNCRPFFKMLTGDQIEWRKIRIENKPPLGMSFIKNFFKKNF